jgi:TP901 family phage tail tape measure protein
MSFSVQYNYTIADRFSSIMKRMSAAAGKFDSGISRMQSRLGNLQSKFQATGAKLANLQTGLASIGAGVFLKGALEESMAFQKSLNMTQAVTGSTAEQMDLMRNKALEWGAQTQFSSGAVAQAMAELGKMGNKTNDIIALMPGTMALAAAGEISMGEAANFSMGILNQFGLGLDKAVDVADILATGASGAATSVSGLASAMNNTGLMANMAGLSITDTTKALMAMATKNIEGAEAGTLFKNAMKELSVMTDKTRGGFDEMGIDIDNFRNATTGQITDFWGLIEAMKATGEVGQGIMTKTFSIRAMQSLAAIVGTDTEKMNEFTTVLEKSSGASKDMATTLMSGLEPMIQFQSIMQNLKVIVGTFVAEAITPLLKKFNEWMGNMQKNNPQTLKWITYIAMGTTALGAILIPLGLMISALGSLIGVFKAAMVVTKLFGITQALLAGIMGTSGASIAVTTGTTTAYVIGTKLAAAATKVWSVVQIAFNAVMSANPIALVIIGIAALIAAIVIVVKYWKQITAAVKNAWTWLVNFYDSMKGLIVIFAPFLIPLLTTIEVIRELVKSFADIKAAFTDQGFIAGILAIGKAILTGLIEPFKGVLDLVIAVKDKIGGAFGAVKDFFTGGGEEAEAASPFASRQQEAPIPGQYGGRGADASASVSVYTEKGLKVEPFTASGDLGYNKVSGGL